jgi:hypothetical protein
LAPAHHLPPRSGLKKKGHLITTHKADGVTRYMVVAIVLKAAE